MRALPLFPEVVAIALGVAISAAQAGESPQQVLLHSIERGTVRTIPSPAAEARDASAAREGLYWKDGGWMRAGDPKPYHWTPSGWIHSDEEVPIRAVRKVLWPSRNLSAATQNIPIGANWDPVLEARSRQIFPFISQNTKRLLWLQDQENLKADQARASSYSVRVR